MASWEYFIYSKSGKYSPEDIAGALISKGYEEGITCKTTLKQNITLDSYTVLGVEIKEGINISEGKEGIMFSSGIENEDKIKQLFNLFQRRDIEAKLCYKFGDIDYKEYFEDAALEINGKTYFAPLKSEKEMMGSLSIPGESYLNQEEFNQETKFNQRYDFYNCTFDDIKFSDNIVIGKLENCRFNRCTFENFNGQKLNLNGSEFAECKMVNSNFENAYFEGADIYRSEINNSYFKLANFSTASIRNTAFKGNNLSSALFYGAVLDDVTMKDTVTEQAAQGLTLDDITIDGASHQEIEANRLQILKQLKIEPVSAQQIYENAKVNLSFETKYAPTQTEINLISKYEDVFNISNSERITEWFGDYSLNVIKPNISNIQFYQQLENAKLDLVEYWHTHDTGNSLREFLGFSNKEFEEIFVGDLPKNHLTNEHTQQHLENQMNSSNKILESKVEPEKITLDDYLAQRGLASPVDDFMIDKLKLPHGQSKYDERKMHENARKSNQEYHEKRNAAIQEYREKVASGEIVEPDRKSVV